MKSYRHPTLLAFSLIVVLIGLGRVQAAKNETVGKQRPAKILSSVKEYQDVRWCDLTKLQVPFSSDLISSFWFNLDTKFGTYTDTARTILERGKNPGLGVWSIH